MWEVARHANVPSIIRAWCLASPRIEIATFLCVNRCAAFFEWWDDYLVTGRLETGVQGIVISDFPFHGFWVSRHLPPKFLIIRQCHLKRKDCHLAGHEG